MSRWPRQPSTTCEALDRGQDVFKKSVCCTGDMRLVKKVYIISICRSLRGLRSSHAAREVGETASGGDAGWSAQAWTASGGGQGGRATAQTPTRH